MQTLELYDSCNNQWLFFNLDDVSLNDLEIIDNWENGTDSDYYSLNEVIELEMTQALKEYKEITKGKKCQI